MYHGYASGLGCSCNHPMVTGGDAELLSVLESCLGWVLSRKVRQANPLDASPTRAPLHHACCRSGRGEGGVKKEPSKVSVRFVECWKAMPSELAPIARNHGLTIILCSKPGMVCFTFLAAHGPKKSWDTLDADMTSKGWKWHKRD